MKPIEMGRPDLVMILDCIDLTLDVMRFNERKATASQHHEFVAQQTTALREKIEQLVAYGDALDGMDQSYDTDLSTKCPKCGYTPDMENNDEN